MENPFLDGWDRQMTLPSIQKSASFIQDAVMICRYGWADGSGSAAGAFIESSDSED